MLQCRRCYSSRLITLDKKSPGDNDVLRCQECGFLFSPATQARCQAPDGAPARSTAEGC